MILVKLGIRPGDGLGISKPFRPLVTGGIGIGFNIDNLYSRWIDLFGQEPNLVLSALEHSSLSGTEAAMALYSLEHGVLTGAEASLLLSGAMHDILTGLEAMLTLEGAEHSPLVGSEPVMVLSGREPASLSGREYDNLEGRETRMVEIYGQPTEQFLGNFASGERVDPARYEFLTATGAAIDISGATITFDISKDDAVAAVGTGTTGSEEGSETGVVSRATYSWAAVDMSVPGHYVAQFWVTKGVLVYASDKIKWYVFTGIKAP